uniref:Uncharacterized protein n=1 Tax=Ditylenchus dipsaci TaxID=166011 RepID=A0A915EHX0_9BILA
MYSYEIYHQNVCVARDGDVTVISEKGSSSGNFSSAGCNFPPSVCTLDCPMNFTISNVNSTGDCDLYLQFNGSQYMLESAPPTTPPIVSTTSPDDSILGTEQTNGVRLGGLETWKLGLIIGVCILLFLLLVGAVACFLIHRYCPDDPETDTNESGKNGPSKVVPTGRKPRGSKPRGEVNLSNDADANKPN